MKQLKSDLNKLENVKEKSEKDKKVMDEKMKQMRTEIDTKFNKVDEIMQRIEEDKKRILVMQKYYSARKETLAN